MKTILRYSVTAFLSVLCCVSALAQTDRREVRAGNRQFRKGSWRNAEIEYRKAQAKDSLSFAANYNLAAALYRQDNFDEAGKPLERLKEVAPASRNASDYYYNLGNVAVGKKDWQAAVDAYKRSLLLNPGDLDAKENYAYAKEMLKNEGGGGGDDNRSQDNNQNQDNQDNQGENDQDRNDDKNGDDKDKDGNQGNQNQESQPDPRQGEGQGESGISPQQAQQMLKAVQAREKETQDKVNKEKAALLKSRQKEKNW